jgi:hypothetical protein
VWLLGKAISGSNAGQILPSVVERVKKGKAMRLLFCAGGRATLSRGLGDSLKAADERGSYLRLSAFICG